MAKFCANCGAQMEDTDRVCGQCGTPAMDIGMDNVTAPVDVSAETPIDVSAETPIDVSAETPIDGVAEVPAMEAVEEVEQSGSEDTVENIQDAFKPDDIVDGDSVKTENNSGQSNSNSGQPNLDAATEQIKKLAANKNVIIGAIACACLAIVLIVVISFVSSATGYKGTLNKMCKAIKDYDIESLEDLASSINEEIIEDHYGRNKDPYDIYEDRVSDVLDKYEDKVGEIKKITYDISDFKELSDRKVKNIKEDLEDEYNMDTSDIKKIAEVKLKLHVKGKKKTASYNVRNLYMIKEGGKWKLLYGDFD